VGLTGADCTGVAARPQLGASGASKFPLEHLVNGERLWDVCTHRGLFRLPDKLRGMEITAAQFSLIEPFLPVQRGNVSLRNLQVVNAMLSVAENR